MKQGQYEHIVHGFAPVWDAHSRVLILGTLPSVKSREQAFYYGHPQNRFWRLLARLYERPVPESIEEKRSLLLSCRIALWDVVGECDIRLSADSSIRNVRPNDIRPLLEGSEIRAVCTNGAKAHELYRRHLLPLTGTEDLPLPSTSPANAALQLDALAERWAILKEITG